MRIAIDGSFLSLPPSGTATYLRGLIAGMRSIDPTIELDILEPDWDAPASVFSRLSARVVPEGLQRRLKRAEWELWQVGCSARTHQPDLLHIPHFSAPVLPRLPLVVTVHDVIPLALPEYRASVYMRLHLQAIRRAVSAARIVLTPSDSAASDVERILGRERKQIRVTPEAADDMFRPAADSGEAWHICRDIGVTGRFVFNVGGLDVRKNLHVLIEAFARVAARIDEPLSLVIAGAAHSQNGSVFPPLAPVIKRFGLERSVLLPGRITEEQKLALYQCAAVYATPSLYEGFGLTALEAMSCGTPVVASNLTSLPEVVGDGGLLVDANTDAFAGAMMRLLTDSHLAADLSRAGLRRAGMFSWKQTARLTIAAYHEALSLRP